MWSFLPVGQSLLAFTIVVGFREPQPSFSHIYWSMQFQELPGLQAEEPLVAIFTDEFPQEVMGFGDWDGDRDEFALKSSRFSPRTACLVSVVSTAPMWGSAGLHSLHLASTAHPSCSPQQETTKREGITPRPQALASQNTGFYFWWI